MKIRPFKTDVPPNSKIAKKLTGANFYDAWCVISDNAETSALEHFILAARKTPAWVDICMSVRNKAGKWVGLKDLGKLSDISDSKPANDYKPGDRVGIFTVFENTFDEALIEDKDKHLNVMLSIHRKECDNTKQTLITITTVVYVKNMLGRIYMMPVKPMHALIAPSVLSKIGSDA